MKKILFLFLAVCLFTIYVSGQKTRPKSSSNPPLQKEQLLKDARDSWTPFITKFRAAMKNNDRKVLGLMVANNFSAFCDGTTGFRIFEEHGTIIDRPKYAKYLDILTSDKNILSPIKYDKNKNEQIVTRTIKIQCDGLIFEFRRKFGWQVVHYNFDCGDC